MMARPGSAIMPLAFGPPSRQLFGLYHAASEASGAPRRGLLLCNPFGHEAIRTHRLFRVLADRLSASGVAVLRFDYFGTGDSPGDDEEGELTGWVGDLLEADAQLRRLSGSTQINWVAARLGAAVALQALQSTPRILDRLLLWDPIVDGVAYLNLLRAKHVEALELSYCIPDPQWRRSLANDPNAFTQEAIGFSISPTLRAGLEALVPTSLVLPKELKTRVLADPLDAAVQRWALAQLATGSDVRWLPFKHSVEWTSDPQPNSAMVPAAALQRLTAELHE